MPETDTPRTRRTVLAAAVGAAAATAAATLSRPLGVTAGDWRPAHPGSGECVQRGDRDQRSVRCKRGLWRLVKYRHCRLRDVGEGLRGPGGEFWRQWPRQRRCPWPLDACRRGRCCRRKHLGWNRRVTAGRQGAVPDSKPAGRLSLLDGRMSISIRVRGVRAGTPLGFATLRSYRPGVDVAAARANYPSSASCGST